MLDKTKLFVVNAITREGIAEDLNEYLANWKAAHAIEPFTPDDDRLTDEVCTSYANSIGCLEPLDMTEDDYEEALAEACSEAITAYGTS